jgi:hypothetical protein
MRRGKLVLPEGAARTINAKTLRSSIPDAAVLISRITSYSNGRSIHVEPHPALNARARYVQPAVSLLGEKAQDTRRERTSDA